MQEINQADIQPDGSALEVIEEDKDKRPPQATLKRRAQSYTDFHHAATAVLRREQAQQEKVTRLSKTMDDEILRPPKREEDICTDLDFVDWYHDLEAPILDSNHDAYAYVT